MQRRLLVTGGCGFIGSSFVELATKNGDYVVVLDKLTYAGNKENLAHIKENYELIVGDIADSQLVSKVLAERDIDAVINFAAESHVDNSINSPQEFIETNIIGTYNMLQSSLEYWQKAAKSHFRYIQISTDEVFGSLGETGKFTETSPMRPNSPYSASKAAGDHLTRAWYETYKLPAITTNCTNNYGPRQYPEKLIPTIITRAMKGEFLPIYGNGLNIRDWIHVEDHNRGIMLALNKGRIGEVYGFGGNAEKTNIDLVNKICDILDEVKPSTHSYKNLIKFVEDRKGHDQRYAIDDSKAEKELGYSRSYDFETGLRATIKWYLNID